MYTATYSPEDNKLRLYSTFKLDEDIYARAKSLGFRWAAKQELFVAPMWTPQRESFLLSLVDEIEDETTSVQERAEIRAERFEGYQDKRANEAENLYSHATSLSENIPLGQPILVGHHSEKAARRQAEKIENAMSKAVSSWETSEYWAYRAKGVISSANYKDKPVVRARRIKGLEADKRKQERTKKEAETFLKLWEQSPTMEKAKQIANYDHISRCFTLEEYPRSPPVSQYEGMMGLWSALDGIIDEHQAAEIAIPAHKRTIANCTRWIAHIENRLSYEKAILDGQGGSDLLKPKARPKSPHLLNVRKPEGYTIPNPYHRGENIFYDYHEMTKAEYAKLPKDYKGTRKHNGYRFRIGSRGMGNYSYIFLTDSKEHKEPQA